MWNRVQCDECRKWKCECAPKAVKCLHPDGGGACNKRHFDDGWCELFPDYECDFADVDGEEC